MLLDEHPAVIISQCVSNFNVAPDKAAIGRSESSYRNLERFRKDQIKVEQDKLHQLSRNLSSLQSQHNVLTQSHNPAEHAADILRLDTEKFKVAKQVSDLEIEEERLASELDRLKAELDEVDAQGLEGGNMRRFDESDEDSLLLKLRIYRMMGISPEIDPLSGNYTKASLVSKTRKGDSKHLDFTSNVSRKYHADFIWDHI
ncbi:kinetochore protein spc24 [Diplodia corticola]|uniref:Kinetochore protein Spc24 n=1 Tax=Diplodia corticola TaxID=236234 RepID=A0A1J9R1I7_9PEZI|nr:kinetochore protein spc24 [Diplodia corticola]OJD34480.1 kinetochore protein spc24 [Diplodia corticola]